MRYKFKKHVYSPPYTPYFDRYKGHEFEITSTSEEDTTGGHVFVKCITDTSIVVVGCVHLHNLEQVTV